MRRLRALLVRFRETLSPRPDEFADEIDSHLQLHIDDNLRAGMTPDEARRHALIRLGGVAQTRERYRDRHGIPALDALRQDLVSAVRVLRKNPGFAATAILTLALGIGANSAIFSLVNATLLRPLPFRDPDRLVMIFATDGRRGIRFDEATYPDFVDWRNQNRTFESMGAYANRSLALSVGDQTVLIQGKRITPNLFAVLGVRPSLGRTFHADEQEPGATGVVIVSDGFWKRHFGGAPDVLGRIVRVSDEPHTVVGVMPPSFHIDQRDDEQFYTPVAIDSSRGHNFLHVIGRLREGATLRHAAADMAAIADRLARLYPRTNAGVGTNLRLLPDGLARQIKPGLFTMLGVVSIVLLIACANVAGLMLARGATRQRELAIRAALGAGRSRLARQLLTESVLIALLGGGLGLIAADWSSRALAVVMSEQFHVPRIDAANTDLSVLTFTVLVSFAAGIVFGAFPACSFASPDLNGALRDAGRAATGARGPRVRRGLVVGEIALALVLLAGAGLLMRTLLAMRATHPGFDTRNLLVADLWLPPARFARLQDRAPFLGDTLSRLRRLPGVTAAAFVADLPLNGRTNTESFHIVGRPDPSPGRAFNAGFNIASAGYFRMMGTPIRDGREFVETDGPNTPGVAIVNETAARTLWPDRSPVGQQISLPIDHLQKSVLLTIVGVAADVRHVDLVLPTRAQIFVHSMQSDLNWPWLVLAVRAASAPAALADPVRAILREVNPNVPITRINSADEVVARSITEPRLYTFLLGTFALLAVALAAIGLYGLISYSVSQRSHEIGVRVALGASRADIFRLVLAQGVALAALGSVIGLACGLAATRALVGLIKGVQPNDPVTLVAVTAVLIGVAMLASYVPARRAARVDPAAALRAE
jgi:putative ABC transport system permease protein